MINKDEVKLSIATPSDITTLSNLFELYAHDLSDIFGLELGSDGRFGYEKLPLYWSEPERRFPFLIYNGNRIAGFALITRGSPASDNPNVFDVAEFFVVRRHRRSNVGRQAAFLLWDKFPGSWIVRVSEGNQNGYKFWLRVIGNYTGSTQSETIRPGNPHAWRVFSFNTIK